MTKLSENKLLDGYVGITDDTSMIISEVDGTRWYWEPRDVGGWIVRPESGDYITATTGPFDPVVRIDRAKRLTEVQRKTSDNLVKLFDRLDKESVS